MFSTQVTPNSIDIINKQLDELQIHLLKICELYQDHPDPFHFRHVLSFNCLWRWKDHFIGTSQDSYFTTFKTIREITDFFSAEKKDAHFVYYWSYRKAMYSNMTLRDNSESETIHDPDMLIDEEKLRELFFRWEELQKSAETIKSTRHLFLRAQKFSCLFPLFYLGVFTPEYLELLWQLPLEQTDEMVRTLHELCSTSKYFAQSSQHESKYPFERKHYPGKATAEEVKLLFAYPDHLKKILLSLNYLHKYEIPTLDYLQALPGLSTYQMQLLQGIFITSLSGGSSNLPRTNFYSFEDWDENNVLYDNTMIAKALFDNLLTKTDALRDAHEETNANLSSAIVYPVNFSIKVSELKEVLQYLTELNELYRDKYFKPKKPEHLVIPDNLSDDAEIKLNEDQLDELITLVIQINDPKILRELDEEIFQFKKKVQDSKLAVRIFGEEKYKFLHEHCPYSMRLAVFLIEPSRYELLNYIDNLNTSVPSLDPDKLLGCKQRSEIDLLIPSIVANDRATISGMVCGFQWLGHFNLRNAARLKHIQDSPLGMRLLAQVNLDKDTCQKTDKIAEVDTTRVYSRTAYFIYDSLLPLIQTKEVADFFRENPCEPREPIIDGGYTPQKPVVKTYQLENTLVEIVNIVEYDTLRRKEIRILHPLTREIQHTFIESKYQTSTLKISMLSANHLITTCAYELSSSCFGGTYETKFKIWDLRTNTCIKESKATSSQNEEYYGNYKLLAGNRLAYYEPDSKICIYNMDTKQLEMKWTIDAKNNPPRIGDETDEGLIVIINKKEITLPDPEKTFALARHSLFAEKKEPSVVGLDVMSKTNNLR